MRETNSPDSIVRSIPCSATVLPREDLRHVVELDDARAMCSGARRTMSRSATTTATKKKMPSSAAMRFVAQSSCGSIE
jgi:hypothetical protein